MSENLVFSPTLKKKPKPQKRGGEPPRLSEEAQALEPLEPSFMPDEDSVVTKRNIPLWTAKWDSEALKSKRLQMGAREFDRGFRQRAISEEDLLFKHEWIDGSLDRSLVIPDAITSKDFWGKFPRDAGVDLAISEAQSAAYFAIVGILTTKDWHRWLLTVFLRKGMSFGQQASAIVEHQDRFHFDIVNVENNAYQESLVRHFKEDGLIGKVPVRGFRTGRLQKVDIELGIPSMAVELEQGRYHIPYGNARTRRIVEPLVEQLLSYPTPGTNDDAVMACFFAREARRQNMHARADISIIRV
jgi:hypothetical protein